MSRQPQRRNALATSIALALAAWPAVTPHAASCTWLPTSGNWGAAANWSCGIVPGAADDATIALTRTVTIDTAQAIRNLGNAGTLNLDAFLLSLAGGGGTTNTGTINVGGASTAALQMNGGHNITNTGGLISIGNGSSLNQFGGTIAGGTIGTSGTGALTVFNSSANFLSGVTLNGLMDMSSNPGSRQRVTGGITLGGTGVVTINGNSILSFEGTQTIAGNGTFVFGSTGGGNRFDLDGTGTTTLAAGSTIRGHSGTIGQEINIGGTQVLQNLGLISADTSGGTISFTGSTVDNRSILEARNSGTLVLNTDVAQTASGVIHADTAGVVLHNGSRITGGTITTAGGGVLRASGSSTSFLDAVTLSGTLDLAGGGRERVANGMTLSGGTININNNGILSFEGNGTLGGSGTIVFGATGAGNRLDLDGNGTTTFGPNVVVRGQNGTIGQEINISGTQTLVNNGLISADAAGGTISIMQSAVTNNGTLEARNGGTLALRSNVTQSGTGTILGDGGVVTLEGVRVTGGTIASGGTGAVRPNGSGANYLDATRITGTLDMGGGARERVNNGLVVDGLINLNGNGILSFEDTQTVSGSGAIVLGSTGGGNRIDLDGNGTTTFGANVTVRGHSGTIGQQINIAGTQTLVNLGTIHADSGGAISLVDSAVVNHGLLRASSGSLNFGVNVSGTGTLQSDPGGTINLANGGNAQGRLAMGAAGSAIHVGNGNLTISNDYTNIGAGSGNSFNRRAGVTGTGQVVAGGDAAQVITGGSVTGGTTTSATLTIGAVRVGTPTTFNYQVANAGTTGPTLRGAIQTSVNGGNLTDPRLSGSGVTASNYNAGAPGGSSGDLAVTFATATPGAIAPLTGQVLNLRSNFENIPDQKLNIVVGAGAGAYVPATGDATAPVTLPNQRVGGTASTTLTVTNTASGPGGFVEDLKALVSSVTGFVTGSGTIVNRQAGTSGTGSGAITVGVDTTAAGNRSGTVNLQYRSQGTVAGAAIPGLAEITAGTQGVGVSGNVYQPATGQIVTAPLNFGTVQVGQVVSQPLVIGNIATGAGGYVEDLNAAFGSATDTRILGAGSIAGVRGGTTSTTTGTGAMTVSVDTSAVGSVAGSIRVNYTSAGAVAGVSNGLGLLARGGEDYAVTGNIEATVIATAKPVTNGILSPSAVTVNLGNLRIGTATSQSLSVLNQAVGGDQAQLKGTISGTGAPVTTAGSITALLPGATSTAMSIGVSGAAPAGPIGGGATISWISDASNIGGCGTTCELGLPSQAVNLAGAVYRLAQPQISTGTVTIAARVGDAVAASRPVTLTNVSPDIYTEGLKATVSGASGNAQHNGGSIANLAAGGTDATSIRVGLASTATPGAGSGSVQLAFVSTGAGTTGAPDIAATTPTGMIDVQSRVYTPATGSATGRTVDFGTVRVGDTVAARNVTVTNTAAATALNDTLRADLSTIGGPVIQGGSPITGLGAGAAAAFSVGLNTTAAGLVDRSGTIGYLSQNPDMADASGGADEGVRVLATINNLANADFDQLAGAGVLTQSGTDYVLDLGTITLGGGLSVVLGLDNDVAGPADALTGSFDLSGADDFGYTGWGPIATALAAGEGIGGLTINFTALGAHEDTIVFNGLGINPSDPTGLGQVRRLLIRANVVDGGGGPVPEPGTLVLILGAAAGALVARRRRERTLTH
ncbi:MAG: choice-of-anchor D domain-containing protein [Rubrivivax sp.]|nr:choice-of-anchor D domain-containing protein [Rubrivivax sp.]